MFTSARPLPFSGSILLVLSFATLAYGTLGNATVARAAGWERQKLDDTFRAEGATAFDVNKDGKIDVVVGEVWYEAPD